MKIVTVLMSCLIVLTVGAFVEVWREIPSVNQSAEILGQQQLHESVQMGLSSAETPAPPAPPRSQKH